MSDLRFANILLEPPIFDAPLSSDPIPDTLAYETVALIDFSEALRLMKRGFGLARLGWKQRGAKWVRRVPESPTQLVHYEMVYHSTYPSRFASRSTPFIAGNCDLEGDDWFIHPLAPRPTAPWTGPNAPTQH